MSDSPLVKPVPRPTKEDADAARRLEQQRDRDVQKEQRKIDRGTSGK